MAEEVEGAGSTSARSFLQLNNERKHGSIQGIAHFDGSSVMYEIFHPAGQYRLALRRGAPGILCPFCRAELQKDIIYLTVELNGYARILGRSQQATCPECRQALNTKTAQTFVSLQAGADFTLDLATRLVRKESVPLLLVDGRNAEL